jgi:hypothetical protein
MQTLERTTEPVWFIQERATGYWRNAQAVFPHGRR